MREVLCTDAQVTQYFPQGERSAAFKWKDYSPQVFQRLRGIFGIDNKARSSIQRCALSSTP